MKHNISLNTAVKIQNSLRWMVILSLGLLLLMQSIVIFQQSKLIRQNSSNITRQLNATEDGRRRLERYVRCLALLVSSGQQLTGDNLDLCALQSGVPQNAPDNNQATGSPGAPTTPTQPDSRNTTETPATQPQPNPQPNPAPQTSLVPPAVQMVLDKTTNTLGL